MVKKASSYLWTHPDRALEKVVDEGINNSRLSYRSLSTRYPQLTGSFSSSRSLRASTYSVSSLHARNRAYSSMQHAVIVFFLELKEGTTEKSFKCAVIS